MGFDLQTTRFVLEAKRCGVDFSSTATLGRQTLALTMADFATEALRYDLRNLHTALSDVYGSYPYADALLKRLGAAHLDAIDVSSYEGASIVLDMNRSVPEPFHGRYSAVIDGGTLEHIFDVPQALRNVAALLRVGGHFISVNGTNNFMGHGFYQFSPEFFFRVLSAQNGFELETLILAETHRDSYWYEATDPAVVRERLLLVNGYPTYVMVRAKKIADVPMFAAVPQQSDYRDQSWQGTDIHAPPESEREYRAPLVRRIARHALPRTLKLRLRALAQAARNAYASPHLRRREP